MSEMSCTESRPLLAARPLDGLDDAEALAAATGPMIQSASVASK